MLTRITCVEEDAERGGGADDDAGCCRLLSPHVGVEGQVRSVGVVRSRGARACARRSGGERVPAHPVSSDHARRVLPKTLIREPP